MEKSVHIIVKGKVQGVFFRDFTQEKATSLGIKGTVRNRRDGSVEIYARGLQELIKEFEQWCWEGSPYSRVVQVVSRELDVHEDYPNFRVIY